MKTLIKKITASEIFPKIFWGIIFGIGISNFEWLINKIDQYPHFIGPIFGTFAGITVGASSRPFSTKKSLYCICAGFIGGLSLIIYSFISGYSLSRDFFALFIFSFVFMPIAIGIADRSLTKVISGLIFGSIGFFFYTITFICTLLILMLLGSSLGIKNGGWFGLEIAQRLIETYPIFSILSIIANVFGGIFIVTGVEIVEVKDILLVKLKKVIEG